MSLVLVFLVLMIVVYNRAAKLEKVNKPALYAIEMALALPVIVGLTDMAGNAGFHAPAGTGLLFLLLIVSWPVVVTILSVCGLTRYRQDREHGGLKWCVAAVVLVLLLAMIAVPNFLTAAAAH